MQARLSNELGRLKKEAAAARAREEAAAAARAKEESKRPIGIRQVALKSSKTVTNLLSVNTITAVEHGVVTSADKLVGAKRADSALVLQAREAMRSARRDMSAVGASGAAAKDTEPSTAAASPAEDTPLADAASATSQQHWLSKQVASLEEEEEARAQPAADLDAVSVQPVLQQEDALSEAR